MVNHAIVSKILLATDFSDSATLAQVYTVYLAGILKTSVVVLHVSEPPSRADAGMKDQRAIQVKLRTLQDSIGARSIPVSCHYSRGNPGEQILSVARRIDADLIVMGVQGQTHVPYGLLGATTHSVTTEGPCPVMTVPLPRKAASPCTFAEPEAVRIRRILAPVDFSGPSLDSLECAIHFAHGLGAHLVLAHVLEPAHADWDLQRIQGAASIRDEWETRLGDLGGVIKSLGLSTTCELRTGFPPDSILAGALQHQCDLIVMGTHGRRGREGPNVGSVADAVLKQAICPVVTVKNPKFVPGGRPAIRAVLSRKREDAAGEAPEKISH
ncbi:MAG TPA: universal stress protein [Nitrospira sp.]|nr:universal stress protein [Nitrospira sp.]